MEYHADKWLDLWIIGRSDCVFSRHNLFFFSSFFFFIVATFCISNYPRTLVLWNYPLRGHYRSPFFLSQSLRKTARKRAAPVLQVCVSTGCSEKRHLTPRPFEIAPSLWKYFFQIAIQAWYEILFLNLMMNMFGRMWESYEFEKCVIFIDIMLCQESILSWEFIKSESPIQITNF